MKRASLSIYYLSITIPRQVGSTSEVLAKQTRSYETCYAPLSNADADNDDKLSTEEYAQFIIASGDESVISQSYNDLAFELQVAFVYSDCLCSVASGNCCDGYIDISGSNANESPTDEQLVHLNEICSKTQSVLDEVMSSGSNTDAPTAKPIETVAPTNSPVTSEPSHNPSLSPIKSPTVYPSTLPTQSPEVSPTTLPPSPVPSSAPSLIYTSKPSQDPSTSPVNAPSASPSRQPTSFPSISPEKSPTSSPVEAPITLAPSTNPSLSPLLKATAAPSMTYSTTSPPSDFASFKPSSSFASTQATDESTDIPSNYSPSSINLATGVSEVGKGNETETNAPSAGVIFGILLPLVAVIAAGLFAFAKKRKKDDEALRYASMDRDRDNVDEEIGASSSAIQPEGNDRSAVAHDQTILSTSIQLAESTHNTNESRMSASEPDTILEENVSYAQLDIATAAAAAVPTGEDVKERTSLESSKISELSLDVEKQSQNTDLIGRDAVPNSNTDDVIEEVGNVDEDDNRTKIESLVLRVIPNEKDKIDDMVRDFEGREDELISMLELMEEQQAAAQANQQIPTSSNLRQAIERGDWQAVGQAASIMARESTADSSVDNSPDQTLYLEKEDRIKHLDDLIAKGDWIGLLTAAGQYEALDTDLGLSGEQVEIESILSEPPNHSELDDERSCTNLLLKQAIENGDWRAVGEAAAIMGKESMTMKSTDNTEPPVASQGEDNSYHTLYLEKEDRTKHLDELVAKGDWTGIVIASGQYQAMDDDLEE